MGLNIGRWLKYAQAKLDHAVADDNAELDRLEAQREVELADRPWLADDAEAPSFDDAKARIEWEAAEQERRRTEGAAPAPPTSPSSLDERAAADVARARIEIEDRERQSKARLDAIRAELGVEGPGGDEG